MRDGVHHVVEEPAVGAKNRTLFANG